MMFNAPLDNVYMLCDRFSAIIGNRVILKLWIDYESVLNQQDYISKLKLSTQETMAKMQVT